MFTRVLLSSSLVATPALVVLVNDFDRLPRAARAMTIAALAVVGLSLYDLLGRELAQKRRC